MLHARDFVPDLINSLRDIFYVIAANGTLAWLSLAFETVTGWRREDWHYRPFSDLLHPDDLEVARRSFGRTLQGHVPPPSDFRILKKDGGYVTVELLARPLEHEGRVIGTFGVARDVTERIQAEEALGESEERFRSAFDHAPIGMAIATEDGRIRLVNEALCRILGYSGDELTSMWWQDITHPDDVAESQEFASVVISGELDSAQRLEKRYIHKDGHLVWGELAFSSVRNRNGKPLYFIAQVEDITRRKEDQVRLERAREELEGRVERQMTQRNPYQLTFRELTVLYLLAAGRSDKEIGTELVISPLTARKHTSNILAKMAASSRTVAAARALREGLLD